MQQNEANRARKMLPRILAVALVLLAVAGAYAIKNRGSNDVAQATPSATVNTPAAEATARNTAALSPAPTNAQVDYSSAEFGLDVTNNFDFDKIMSYGLPVLMDFGAEGCYACEQFMPTLEDLNKDLRGKAVVKYVDVWKDQSAGEGFPLTYIPTQFFFDKDGNPYMPPDPDKAEENGFVFYKDKTTGAHILTAHIGILTYEEVVAVLKELGMQ